jgi:ATP diphosphatase
VLRNWEQIKAEERRANNKNGESEGQRERASLLDGVSRALPATLEGFQLTRKASRIGFDWHNADGVMDKIREERAELEIAIKDKNQHRIEEEMGDFLFAAVNLARLLHVDPEIALKKANAKFSRRFRAMEASARESGREFKDLPREEMEALWETAKAREEKSETAARAQARK